MKAISFEEAKRIDDVAIYKLGVPRIALMENAGRGVAEFLLKKYKSSKSIIVVSGGGYNGGDGLVAARHLYINGVKVRVFLVADMTKLKDETLVQLNILKGLGVKIDYIESESSLNRLSCEIKRRDLLIDALMGIGVKGLLREPQKSIVELVNRSKIKVLSVDIPSGLNADYKATKSIRIKADWTVTFKEIKRVMVLKMGREYCGKIYTVGIGI